MNKLIDQMKLDAADKATAQMMLTFVEKLIKLGPTETFGVARILGVSPFKDMSALAEEAATLHESKEEQEKYIKENCLRDTEVFISEMIDAYCGLNRTRRRNLMKILNKVK